MRKLIAILIAVAMVAAITPMVGADDSDSIVITLTPGGAMSIEVGPDTWEPEVSIGGHINSTFNIWNNGSVSGTVDVSAAFVEEYNDWALGASAGVDTVYLAIDDGATNSSIHDGPLAGYFTLAHTSGTDSFELYLEMPTASTTNETQKIEVTFTGVPA
jgi:hypothetical protein